jgi:hypothetical protein
MRRQLVLAAAVAIALGGLRAARADDWIFLPSYYTHDPATGQRVAQFAPVVTPCVEIDPTYQRSGYVHNESTLQVGDSAVHTHIVETWGQGTNIRPYDEWLYPYRPGATPYNPGWGSGGPGANASGGVMGPYGPGAGPYSPWMASPYGQPNPGWYGQPNPGPYGPTSPYAPQGPWVSPPPNPGPPGPPQPAPPPTPAPPKPAPLSP